MRAIHAIEFAYGCDVVIELSAEEAAHAREVVQRSQRWHRRRGAAAQVVEDRGTTGGATGVDEGATGGEQPDIEVEMGPAPVSPSLLRPLEVVSPSGSRHVLPALEEHNADPDVLYVPAAQAGDRFVCGPLTVIADCGVRHESQGEVGAVSPRNFNLSTAQVDWGLLGEDGMLNEILGLGEDVPLADWLESEEFRTLNLELLVGDTPIASASVSPSTSGTQVHVMVPVGEEVDALGERRLVLYTGVQEGEDGAQGEDRDQEGDGQLDFLVDDAHHILISRPSILKCGWMTDFLRDFPEASIHDLLISWFRGERGVCPQVWRDRYIFASGMQLGQRVLAHQVVKGDLHNLDYSDVRSVHSRVTATCEQLSGLMARPQAYTGFTLEAASPGQGDGDGVEEVEEVEVVDIGGDVASGGPVYEDVSEAEGELRDSPESPDEEEFDSSSSDDGVAE